jgi:23S rRNA (cytidine1920-2'-O)/16S rRNA (cytidine1409-2'-O)-methyltransferase
VRDVALRREAVAGVAAAVGREAGVSVLGFAPSGLPGPAGNRETFVWLGQAGRPGAVSDIEAALAEVDA